MVSDLNDRGVRQKRTRRGVAAASALLFMTMAAATITRSSNDPSTAVAADERPPEGTETTDGGDTTSTTATAEDAATSSTTVAAVVPPEEPALTTSTTVVRCPDQGGPPEAAQDVKTLTADFDGDGAADTLYAYARPDLEYAESLRVRITLANGDAADRAVIYDFSPHGAPEPGRAPTPVGADDLFGDKKDIAFVSDSNGPNSHITFVPYFWAGCSVGTVERDGVVAAFLLDGGSVGTECVAVDDGLLVIERQRDSTRPEAGYEEYRSAWRTRERIERIDRTAHRFVETADFEPLHRFRCGDVEVSHYPEKG